jgi:hypothetical protein
VVKENSEVRNKKNIQSRILGRQSEMARLKNTQRKRIPLGKELPESLWCLTRMEQVAREEEISFHTLVTSKGKEVINGWEEEIKDEHKGKEWDDLVLEVDWVTDPGDTHPRETLYHKMVEVSWLTKLLIGKVKSETGGSKTRR